MKKLLGLIVGILLLASPAFSQNGVAPKQSGNVTPGHPVMWLTNGVLADAGTPVAGKLSGLGITASGPSFCINSDLTTALGGYQQLCFGTTTANGGKISIQNFGAATPQGISWQIDGVNSGIGLVQLPTTANDVACFNDTVGTLVDCSFGAAGTTGTGKIVLQTAPTIINPTISGIMGINTAPVAGSQLTIVTSGTNIGLQIGQTQSGTASSGINNNLITIVDSINAGASFSVGFLSQLNFGSSTALGGREALVGQAILTSATNASNTNRNYVGTQGLGIAQSGDGGSGLTTGTAKGAIFGLHGYGVLRAASTNMFGLSGGEFNTTVETGGSVALKSIIQLSGALDDRVQGSVVDAMQWLYNQSGAVKWNYGWYMDNAAGLGDFPIKSTGTLIGTGVGTLTHAIDLSNLTCSTDCFKSTGFSVDGSGNGTLNSATLTTKLTVGNGGTGLSAGTSGGVPYFNSTSTMASSGLLAANGIVIGGGAGAAPVTSAGCSIPLASGGGSLTCTSATSANPAMTTTNTTNDAGSAIVFLRKERSGATVQNGDQLGAWSVLAFVAAYQNASYFRTIVDGALSGNNVPTRWEFTTSNAAGQINQTIAFNSGAHLAITAQATLPTITAGCTGAGSGITGGAGAARDVHGTVTGSTGAATTCTVTFGTAFTNAPDCVFSGFQSPITVVNSVIAASFQVTFASTANFKFTYHCLGV